MLSRRLDEALALPLAERDSWLDELHEPDAFKLTLRRLLADDPGVETDDFLASLPRLTFDPAGSPGEATGDADAAGVVVGPYRLLHELGVGGMGHVWLAERADGGLKRQVALKLPRLSWARGLSERMGRERDILASLDHPNIARIYDAGLDLQGRPYLALEYVVGERIDVYCKRLALPIADRLRLVLQIAHAVAHAHARLVVHRDLKPANILVTSEGKVRLLDFGIAKLMEGAQTQEAELTAIGGRALTLDYASPEQIRGEPLGAASDVYSLGVVSYELLAEAKPYQLKRQSAAALEDAIASVDVRLASTAATGDSMRRALRGDLDAILNKALKKDLAERYPTVEAFAQDIERHLASQPVHAYPDALAYRARKFVRRNKLALAAAAAISVSLIAGLSGALWQARVARAQAERAEQVKEFALSIFDSADTDSGAGSATTAADLLKTARKRVASELADRPELAVELMTAIGYSMLGQGQTGDAHALMHDAVELSAQQLGPRHSLTTAALVVYGEALVELGQNAKAIVILAPAIDAALSDGDLRTLITALRWTSSAQLNEGQIDQAVESARKAVAALSMKGGRGKPLRPLDAMEAHQNLANTLLYARKAGAADAAKQALVIAREIYGQRTVLPVLEIRTQFARAAIDEGQIAAGLRELEDLLPDVIGMLGPTHPRVATIANLVGSARLNAGDVRGAIEALRQGVAISDVLREPDSEFNRGAARFELARAYAVARQPADALVVLEEAASLLKTGAGPTTLLTLQTLSARASQLAEAGRLTDADAEFKKLESAGWSGPYLASNQGRLAALRSLQGRHEEALALAKLANDELAKVPRKRVQAGALALLGNVRLDGGDARNALEPLQNARSLYAKTEIRISTDHAETLVALGRAQMALGDMNAAAQSLAMADKFWQDFNPGNRHAGLAKLYLAQATWELGDKGAAAQTLRQADAVLDHSVFTADRALLASTRRRIGR